MKEATRQLVLLIGIMTILTGGLVTINSARTSSTVSQTPDQQVNTSPDPVESNDTADNTESPEPVDTGNSSGLVVQSINGWQSLWDDMKTGWEAILSSSSNSSS